MMSAPKLEPSGPITTYEGVADIDGAAAKQLHGQGLLNLAGAIFRVVNASGGELPTDLVQHLAAFRIRVLRRHHQERKEAQECNNPPPTSGTRIVNEQRQSRADSLSKTFRRDSAGREGTS